MPISAVLFDLDGTIVSAMDWHKDALNMALEKFGYSPITQGEHDFIFNGLPTKKKLQMLNEMGRVMKNDFAKIEEAKQEFTLQLIKEKCIPDPDKYELINYLHKSKISLACVTNSIWKTTCEMLINSNLIQFFDLIITNEDVIYPKPSPAPYIDAMVKLGVLPRNSLIVEDSPVGFQSAQLTTAHLWKVTYPEVNLTNYLKRVECIQ